MCVRACGVRSADKTIQGSMAVFVGAEMAFGNNCK